MIEMCRIFNENLHGTIGSVCEWEIPIKASSVWRRKERRKPDEWCTWHGGWAACLLHTAFCFHGSLKSEHFHVLYFTVAVPRQPCYCGTCFTNREGDEDRPSLQTRPPQGVSDYQINDARLWVFLQIPVSCLDWFGFASDITVNVTCFLVHKGFWVIQTLV